MEGIHLIGRWAAQHLQVLSRATGGKVIRYPLATSSWDDAELQAIRDVTASGRFTMGERVQAFETEFARFVGSRYCVMVNSGSSANLLAVACLFYRKERPLQRGDEVIVPAVSWSTTYFPLYQYGLKLKFVDIDEHTLNYDLECLENAISTKTRLIMVVNLLGNPNDFTAIDKLIRDRDIAVIEDNCESLGAKFNGQQAGTFGLVGTYSAFFSHHISTMEGGMVVTADEELFHILLSLRAHGWTRNLPERNQVCKVKSDYPFDESFRFVLPGYNVRPLEFSGAIGLEQLRKLPEFIRIRRENASNFLALISRYEGLQVQREIGQSSWFAFSLVIEERASLKRRDVLNKFAEAGIETRPIVTGNFAEKEVVKQWFDYSIHGDLRAARLIDRAGFFIGNHHYPLVGELQLLG
jgi:CDP-4-dehydro-6-deoxyglucose reductase, E1